VLQQSGEKTVSFVTPVFVGRHRELAQMNDALDAVQGKAGRCILVSGEAGIGKSRLIAETRARASSRGFTTLVGRCFEQDRSIPYAPLIEMLRPLAAKETMPEWLARLGPLASALGRLLPEMASQLPGWGSTLPREASVEQRRLFQALIDLFLHQAGEGPLLLIVEDLHWSDQASRDFLLYLVRRIAGAPIFLLLSAREVADPSGLDALLLGLDREPIAQQIRLEPLTRAEVAQLLRAILAQPHLPSPEFVTAIYGLTEGNPFFTEEVLTSLIASGDIYYADNEWRRKPLSRIDIPDKVQRVIQRRLDQVSPAARQVIELAAASGRSFDFAVLQALTGHDGGALLALVKELVVAGLVVEESADRFAFRHALTRETLYGHLLVRERQALHGQLVRAIEQIYANAFEPHLESLAYHAFEAGQWAKALDYARRAGEKALALDAPHVAVEQITRAVHAAEQLRMAPDSTLYRRRGQAFDTLGDFDRAREDIETALSAARAAADQRAAWQTLLDLGLLWASRDYERAGDFCRQALALARSMDDPLAIGHSLNRLGNWLMNSGRPFEALDHHREALGIFEAQEDQAGIAATLDLLAMTSNQCGDMAATVTYYERAIPILRRLNDRHTLASSLTMLSNYTLDETQAREALELTREIDWRAGEAYALVYLGSLLAFRGDYGGGLSAAQSGLALAQAIDHRLWRAWGHIILGMIYLELLSPDEAYRHLHRGRALSVDVGSTFMIGFASGLLASTCVLRDRLDEAASLLPDHLPEHVVGADYMLVKASVELALARREPARALSTLDRVALPGGPHWLGAMAYFFGGMLRLRGDILARLERLDDAEAVLHSALDLCREQGVRMGVWRIQLALGVVCQAKADRLQCEAAFGAAQSLISELAATLPDGELREDFGRRATAMIPQLKPLSARQAARLEFGGLTRRERQVAAVVARGLTNQEIADELVITVKTVEAHITHILSKLGFSSRAQIAAWAVDKGLADAPQDLNSR
jgi:DNA-binding CsgD family transcriptional regulator/Tfp pilus assembly protein PilF